MWEELEKIKREEIQKHDLFLNKFVAECVLIESEERPVSHIFGFVSVDEPVDDTSLAIDLHQIYFPDHLLMDIFYLTSIKTSGIAANLVYWNGQLFGVE